MKKLKHYFTLVKKHKRYAVLFVIFALIYALLFVIFRQYNITQDDIRNLVEPFGAWGPLMLLVTQFFFSMTPLPDAAIPMLAYVLYGIPGVLLVCLAMYLASVTHFYIARRVGKKFIVKRFPLIPKYLERLHNGNTILKLITIRLFTLVSFDLTAYIAGVSTVSFRTFSIAAVLGLLPANVILLLISSGLFASSIEDVLILLLLVAIAFAGLAYLYKHSTIKNV